MAKIDDSVKKKVPELRFKGFTDDWEERKLGQYTKLITKGTTPKDKTGIGDVNFVKVENITNGKIYPINKIKQNEHDNYLKRSRLEEKDILFSIAGTLGRTAIVNKSILPANTNQALAIIRGYDFDTNFLITSLAGNVVKEYIRRNPTVGAQPNLSLEQVGNLLVNTPNAEEQQKIGAFFQSIDDTIALHQRKLDMLKEQKKGYLQKMFPKNGAKVPELRFAGFADDWEERKLGDYIIQYSEKTKQNNQYPVFTSSRNGLFFQKDYYKGNQIASEDNTGYNIVPRGYFTYRHMSDDLVFKFNINDLADYGIVSTLYPVFTTNEQLDSKYLQYQLNEGSEFRRFSLLQKQGGSRTYMYLNKLQNMILTIPKLEEQQKIGSFFKQLDDTIALHQRKLDLLKEQKKGYLQKMFV